MSITILVYIIQCVELEWCRPLWWSTQVEGSTFVTAMIKYTRKRRREKEKNIIRSYVMIIYIGKWRWMERLQLTRLDSAKVWILFVAMLERRLQHFMDFSNINLLCHCEHISSRHNWIPNRLGIKAICRALSAYFICSCIHL